jgi:hypothetical protein
MEDGNGISILDFLLVVAENIKLLIFAPLLAGAAVYGIACLIPQTFVSESILLVPATSTSISGSGATVNANNGAQAAAIMVSPLVLDPIIALDSNLAAQPVETARAELFGRVKATVGKDGLLRLSVSAESPDAARKLGEDVIDSWLKSTVPGAQEREDMEKQLPYFQKGLAAVSGVIEKLSVADLGKPVVHGDVGAGFLSVVELQSRYLGEVAEITRKLKGLTRDVVKQPPTLPRKAVSPRKGLVAIIATLATGFALLVLVLARKAWIAAAKDKESSIKVMRIRNAFGIGNVQSLR